MKDPNFFCPVTQKKFFIPKYKMSIKQDKVEYLCGEGVIKNPENGVPLVKIEIEGDFSISIGSSKAVEKTKMINHLKKRSSDHYKKEIAPVKSAMIRHSTPEGGVS